MVNENKLVSIIIPTFNRSYLLLQTIRSIVNQTFKNFEIIVIDDGSTDNTERSIKEFGDSRIRYLNVGRIADIAKLRNIGIHNSKGEFIAFCDSDDLWVSTKLEKQLPFLYSYDFVCSNAEIVDINGVILKDAIFDSGLEDEALTSEVLLLGNRIITSSVLLKKSIITDGFKESESTYSAEDYELWLRLSLDNRILFLHEPLVLYRNHTENTTFESNINSIKLFREVIKILDNYTKSCNDQIRTSARIGIVRKKKDLCRLYYYNNEFVNLSIELVSLLRFLLHPKIFKHVFK